MRAISGLKFKLQKKFGFEFHFSRSSDKIREAFFGPPIKMTFPPNPFN
jgi:hypothetical protein